MSKGIFVVVFVPLLAFAEVDSDRKSATSEAEISLPINNTSPVPINVGAAVSTTVIFPPGSQIEDCKSPPNGWRWDWFARDKKTGEPKSRDAIDITVGSDAGERIPPQSNITCKLADQQWVMLEVRYNQFAYNGLVRLYWPSKTPQFRVGRGPSYTTFRALSKNIESEPDTAAQRQILPQKPPRDDENVEPQNSKRWDAVYKFLKTKKDEH